jgi:hypothetical protein
MDSRQPTPIVIGAVEPTSRVVEQVLIGVVTIVLATWILQPRRGRR